MLIFEVIGLTIATHGLHLRKFSHFSPLASREIQETLLNVIYLHLMIWSVYYQGIKGKINVQYRDFSH